MLRNYSDCPCISLRIDLSAASWVSQKWIFFKEKKKNVRYPTVPIVTYFKVKPYKVNVSKTENLSLILGVKIDLKTCLKSGTVQNVDPLNT